MNLHDALTEVRRKMGIFYLNDKEDIEWFCRKIVFENQEIFDRLA